MRVLNLFAGIGGNRRLWKGVKVTAVESDPQIAAFYSEHFRKDEIIVGDAHQYLLDHFRDFDFIWSSPPCQTHSSFRQNICVRFRGTPAVYPDMKLYQQILFLRHNARCPWVVENVKPYYKTLIPATTLQRHLFWANFEINPFANTEQTKIRTAQIGDLQLMTGFNVGGLKVSNKRQVLRNCVNPKLGMHILDCARQNNIYWTATS